MNQPTPSYAGTQAVVRAIRLLKQFNGEPTVWSLGALVEASQLNKTTVFRLLTALESEGLLEKTAEGHYQLGSEMIALGGRAMRSHSLREVARPILRQLAETTQERVTLEIRLNGAEMLVLDEIASQHLLGVTHYVGTRLPVALTSTGKAVLAFSPGAEPLLPTEQGAQIRQQGYATAVGELEPGLMATAAPIFDHNQQVVGAISIVGPSIRLDEAKLHLVAQQAVQAAEAISYKLGYRVSSNSPAAT